MKEIDLIKILKILLSHIIPIILAGIIAAAGCFVYNFFLAEPTYRTSSRILVNNGGLTVNDSPSNSGTVSGSDISASLYLVATCVDILESDNIYKDLASAMDDEYSYYYLKSCFSANAHDDDSLCIDIYTYGTDPQFIKEIANTFLDIVPTYLSNTISNVEISVLGTADKVVKTGPRTLFNTVVGFVVGVLLCSAVYVIIALSKNIVEGEKDFKSRYDIPLLGVVPRFESKQGGKSRGR